MDVGLDAADFMHIRAGGLLAAVSYVGRCNNRQEFAGYDYFVIGEEKRDALEVQRKSMLNRRRNNALMPLPCELKIITGVFVCLISSGFILA